MKKLIKFLLITGVSILLFVGCAGKGLNDNNARIMNRGLAEELSNRYCYGDKMADEKPVVLNKTDKEKFLCNEEEYTVTCYESYFESHPDIKFRVWKKAGSYLAEDMVTDMEYIYLQHYLEQFLEEKPEASHLKLIPRIGYEADDFGVDVVSIIGETDTAADMESRAKDFADFAQYVKEQDIVFGPFGDFEEPNDLGRYFCFGYESVPGYISKFTYYCHNGYQHSSNTEYFYAGMAVWISQNRQLMNFFTAEEKERYIGIYNGYAENQRKNLYLDWDFRIYSDVQVSPYRLYDQNRNLVYQSGDSYSASDFPDLTPAQTYDMLAAIGWESLEGDYNRFSYTDNDGDKVEFFTKEIDVGKYLYSYVPRYMLMRQNRYFGEFIGSFNADDAERDLGLNLEAEKVKKDHSRLD